MDWKTKFENMGEGARAELAADIAFAEAVNDMAVSTRGIVLAKANAEPFRQFIIERRMLNNGAFASDEAWFLDEARQVYATQIRNLRHLYEAGEEEATEAQANTNAVLDQLNKLAEAVALLQANAQAAPAAPAVEPAAEPAPDAEDAEQADADDGEKESEDED